MTCQSVARPSSAEYLTHRRDDDPIAQREPADVKWSEEMRLCHVKESQARAFSYRHTSSTYAPFNVSTRLGITPARCQPRFS